MKISQIFFTCLIASILPINQYGALFKRSKKNQEESTQEKPIPNRLSRLQIGANYTCVYIKPQTLDSLSGNMGGLQGLYEYSHPTGFYAGLKAMWRQGKATNSSASRTLLNVIAEERLGYTFFKGKGNATLFSGLGYRYFSQGLTQDGSSQNLNYNEFYIPLGLLTDFRVYPFFWIGFNLTWMPQVDPTVTMVPIGENRWPLTRKISNFLIELPFTFYMGSQAQYLVLFKPFYEYWQDGQTKAMTSTGLPLGLVGNTYYLWGGELNFGYKF